MEILQVSEELFARLGYEHTSIQQIADGCGMTKGALYHHFQSKEDVLEEICRNYYQYLLKAAEPMIHQKEMHWLKRMESILLSIRQAHAPRIDIAREYVATRSKEGTGRLGARLAFYDKQFYTTVIAPILGEAREAGDALFEGSPKILAVFIYHIDRSVTEEISEILRAGAKNTEDEIRLVLETFVGTLSAMIRVPREMILELVKIPETLNFFKQLLSGAKD